MKEVVSGVDKHVFEIGFAKKLLPQKNVRFTKKYNDGNEFVTVYQLIPSDIIWYQMRSVDIIWIL